MIGCFNHWVVTSVADKVRRHWLWEVYFGTRGELHKQSEPKPYLTTDNPQTSVATTTLQKYDAFVVTLSLMFSGYYICKIMRWLLDALLYKQVWPFHRCSVVTMLVLLFWHICFRLAVSSSAKHFPVLSFIMIEVNCFQQGSQKDLALTQSESYWNSTLCDKSGHICKIWL